MLRELHIRDYAVIDGLRLELGHGLNVLSGETGAGKSIIVGALALLLGERASSTVIRHGAERALIEGVFEVGERADIARRCDEAGVELDDGRLIVRREVQREGRNRVWINGSPATASTVRELGGELVDLHGQHEHQALLRRSAQLRILDAYAGATELAARVEAAHRSVEQARAAIADARRTAAEIGERADFLRFKVDEIRAAALEPDEEESLEAEAIRLAHSAELLALSGQLHEAVYGAERSILDQLGELRRPLDELIRYDPRAEGTRELFETALYSIEELGHALGRVHGAVDHDPDRLELVRARIDLLHRLKGKYGAGTVADVVASAESAARELERLDTTDRAIASLERDLAAATDDLYAGARRLSASRADAAAKLGRRIEAILPELGMASGRFAVALVPVDPPGPSGAERAEFQVSLNAGFEPESLSRVASGGELSRVMLALKTELAGVDRVPSLVFDEIDAGVGGRVAHRVAERLATVAERHQVFAVTHLPHIAARAHAHWRVDKTEREGATVVGVQRLEGQARVEELARMLGGDPDSGVSRRHAEELLERVRRRAATAAGSG